MATATDVVQSALSYNLNRQSESALEDDELQDGIDVLNDMMTGLESDDCYLGYTYITDGAQQVTVAPGVLLGIKQNLAIQLAPMFGGKVSPMLSDIARLSMKTILNAGISQPKMSYPKNLPRGAGGRWYNQTYNTFFDGPIERLISMYFEANTTDTVIATVSTPVVIAGTWVKTKDRNFTTTAAGLITYTGDVTTQFNLNARFTAEVVGKHVCIYAYLNGVAIAPVKGVAYVATAATIPLLMPVTLKTSDTIQFFIENIDDATDILISSAYADIQ